MAKKFLKFSQIEICILECWGSDYTPEEVILELGLKRQDYIDITSKLYKKLPYFTTQNRSFMSKAVLLSNQKEVLCKVPKREYLIRVG